MNKYTPLCNDATDSRHPLDDFIPCNTPETLAFKKLALMDLDPIEMDDVIALFKLFTTVYSTIETAQADPRSVSIGTEAEDRWILIYSDHSNELLLEEIAEDMVIQPVFSRPWGCRFETHGADQAIWTIDLPVRQAS